MFILSTENMKEYLEKKGLDIYSDEDQSTVDINKVYEHAFELGFEANQNIIDGETIFSRETKVKLFSHTDLDGVGCGILGHLAFGKNLDVEYCDYKDINERVEFFLNEVNTKEYKRVFITDISVNQKVADRIDKMNEELPFHLLDHHITADWLNEYRWAHVTDSQISSHTNQFILSGDTCKSSGTSLFFEWLVNHQCIIPTDSIQEFTELVRRWDTWEWSTMYDDRKAKQLNDLLSLYGRNDFFDNFTDRLERKSHFVEFDGVDTFLLERHQQEIDRYTKRKIKALVVKQIGELSVGIVTMEKFFSEVGNNICNEREDIDLVAMLNLDYNSVSFRTVKDDVDVSAFAQQFGGGGHPKASGCPLPDGIKEQLFSTFSVETVVVE